MLRSLFALAAATALFTNGPASATLITFDDLTPDALIIRTFIPNGYQGLTWNNFGAIDYLQDAPSGYTNGVISKNMVAYNGHGEPASFSGSVFTLNSFYLTAAWNDDLHVTVTGKQHGTIVDSRSFTVSTLGPTLEHFNWTNLDEVDFSSSGGFSHLGGASATQLVIDNLSLTFGQTDDVGEGHHHHDHQHHHGHHPHPVPEPTSLALLLPGLFGLGAQRRWWQRG